MESYEGKEEEYSENTTEEFDSREFDSREFDSREFDSREFEDESEDLDLSNDINLFNDMRLSNDINLSNDNKTFNNEIDDLIVKEEHETDDDYYIRDIITKKLASLNEINNITCVVLGNMIMKKAKLGISYNREIEKTIKDLLVRISN